MNLTIIFSYIYKQQKSTECLQQLRKSDLVKSIYFLNFFIYEKCFKVVCALGMRYFRGMFDISLKL